MATEEGLKKQSMDTSEKDKIKKDGDAMSSKIQSYRFKQQKPLEAFSEGLKYFTQEQRDKYFGGLGNPIFVQKNKDSLKKLFEENSNQTKATLAICSLSSNLCKTFEDLHKNIK